MATITLEQWQLRMRVLNQDGDSKSLIGIVRDELRYLGKNARRDAKRNATNMPRVVTGTLRNSIWDRTIVHGHVVELQLGASVVYARIQELGGTTRHGGKIRSNRFLGKAMDTARVDAKRNISAAIKRYLGEGA